MSDKDALFDSIMSGYEFRLCEMERANADWAEKYLALQQECYRLRDAAVMHVAKGHNDTCQAILIADRIYDCNCGFDLAKQALAAKETP